jgi:hypothetical protein
VNSPRFLFSRFKPIHSATIRLSALNKRSASPTNSGPPYRSISGSYVSITKRDNNPCSCNKHAHSCTFGKASHSSIVPVLHAIANEHVDAGLWIQHMRSGWNHTTA